MVSFANLDKKMFYIRRFPNIFDYLAINILDFTTNATSRIYMALKELDLY